ncbi:MAG: hypothetical protein ACREQN_19705 [Candidatus Binataceae bacterium]
MFALTPPNLTHEKTGLLPRFQPLRGGFHTMPIIISARDLHVVPLRRHATGFHLNIDSEGIHLRHHSKRSDCSLATQQSSCRYGNSVTCVVRRSSLGITGASMPKPSQRNTHGYHGPPRARTKHLRLADSSHRHKMVVMRYRHADFPEDLIRSSAGRAKEVKAQ